MKCPFANNILSKSAMLAILVIISMAIVAAGELTAVVNTTYGPVQGEILTSATHGTKYAAFKGIRYAKPPIRYLRFQPPIPADPWTKTLNATTEATHCFRFEFGEFAGSEDCLFLNVFTPVTNLEEIPKKLKSVIVFIYGGAWMTGSSRIDFYGPDILVAKDVVLVTFNFRSGAFGFLNLNHPNATGNAGLKDQNLVLKWVQANIQYFGGNRNNVTIMGASSGGMSVGYHIISDASVGLFHGAISMSGAPLMPWAFQTPAKSMMRAMRVGSTLRPNSADKENVLKAFYAASARQIAYNTYLLGEIVVFSPTLENASIATDVFLAKCSIGKYFSSNFTKVPQILGFMEQETIAFATCQNKNMREYDKLMSDAIDVVTYLGMDVPQILDAFRNIADSLDYEHLNEDNIATLQASINATTAILFVTHIDITQRIFAAYNEGQPLFYYKISFIMENAPHTFVSHCPIKAAAHTDDIAYLFYSLHANYTFDPKDLVTRNIDRVSTMWTNFAKYGNPTPNWIDGYPLNVTWPKSGPKGFSLNIGDELVVEPRPINNFGKEIETFYWIYLSKLQSCS